jgi:hypothetical protein
MPSDMEFRISIALFQTVFIGLSLWLGITKYLIESDSFDLKSKTIVLMFGFLMLSSSLLSLTEYFLHRTSSGLITDAIRSVEAFTFVIPVGIIGWIIDEAWDPEGTREWIAKFIVAGLGAVILYIFTQGLLVFL